MLNNAEGVEQHLCCAENAEKMVCLIEMLPVQAVSYTDTLRADRLAAGIYNAYHVNYPGNSANSVTFTGTDSRNTLPDQSFQVLPVRRSSHLLCTQIANFNQQSSARRPFCQNAN